jgi:hypothetical protein
LILNYNSRIPIFDWFGRIELKGFLIGYAKAEQGSRLAGS